MDTTLIVVNLLLTAALFILVARQQRKPKTIGPSARLTKPIHHPRVEGPTTAKVTSAIGYWVPKDQPEAEPFLAAWYEKDTTCSALLGFEAEPDEIIPADTYVDLMGRKFQGAKFRETYGEAQTVMEVARFKPKAPLHNANIVSARAATPKLSPEEEAKLAEEYELDGGVTTSTPKTV